MKTALLIRCMDITSEVSRLEECLSEYFGADIYFMLDRYREVGTPSICRKGRELSITRAYLKENGLPFFPKVGWQCGDFIYYAAADALPEYDRYWLIESDVRFTLPPSSFFSSVDTDDADFIAAKFQKCGSTWQWLRAGSRIDENVYSGPFPLTRMTREAAIHLKSARKKYSADPFIRTETYSGGSRLLYANDEAFVATTLMKDGFKCRSLEDLVTEPVLDFFTTATPVLDIDVEHLPGKVLHPVCSESRARLKFRKLYQSPKGLQRMLRMKDEIILRHGQDIWDKYCELDLTGLLPFSDVDAEVVNGSPA